MFRSILVPLDGSAFGEQALPVALALARRSGADLQVVHVCVLPAPLYLNSRPGFDNTRDRRVREQGQAYLDKVVTRLKAAADVPVTSVLLEGGVAEALETYLASARADLLVMTSHGRGPLSRLWLGSVADQLLRQAPLPLLLVRPQETPPELTAEPALGRILIPLDGSALAEKILEPALTLARLVRGRCTLLRAVEPVRFGGFDPMEFMVLAEELPSPEQERVRAQAYLDQVARRLQAEGVAVQTRVVVGEQPAVAILDEARAGTCDLIALATHGRHGLERLLLGSVADKVVRGAFLPVLVYRAIEK